MNSADYNIRILEEKLSSLENKIAGFGVDLTENGFILSVWVIKTDADGSIRDARASFSFGGETRLEDILNLMVGKIKLQRI
jgi:hypothetical protein